jgi:hypothetical protein
MFIIIIPVSQTKAALSCQSFLMLAGLKMQFGYASDRMELFKSA